MKSTLKLPAVILDNEVYALVFSSIESIWLVLMLAVDVAVVDCFGYKYSLVPSLSSTAFALAGFCSIHFGTVPSILQSLYLLYGWQKFRNGWVAIELYGS